MDKSLSTFISLLLLSLASLFTGHEAHAEGQDVSGQWSASPLQVSWAWGSWEAHCGARPSGSGDAGGKVQLTASGAEFQLSGLGRNYSTTTCWEQLPGLQVRSHSASATTIRSSCEMPKGDPRQAKVVTTWALRGDKIYFDETGQYQFLSKEGACTASVRRTRLLSRAVAAKTETEPGATATPTSGKSAATAESPSPTEPIATEGCTGDEPATRVELVVPSSLLRAGDLLSIETRGFARNGCRVRTAPRVEFLRGRELLLEAPQGGFQIKADAPSGDIEVRVRIGDATAEAKVSVVSRAEIEALFADSLKSPSDAAEPKPGSHAGAVSNAAPAAEPSRTPLLLGLFGGLAVCVLALGWLVLRSRGRGTSPDVPPLAPEDPGNAATILAEPAATSLHPAARVCPVCGTRYPSSEAFCGADGSRLVREN